ncbi:hypothetical protein P171DRAFT_448067 [Karstenula rhodostoma CBS 690.94]|uniref:Uncharacterized protein n=1 Tax=Karstenula rhodostoma CBS 690.94 TaxID=1392251 RepID=A0A9P4U7R5_9PLEO|nr:hypothetical protein P171DRAFT_448067 [Karstenula rhodostoma CBS 690.94]
MSANNSSQKPDAKPKVSKQTTGKAYVRLPADEAARRDEQMLESLRSGLGPPSERPPYLAPMPSPSTSTQKNLHQSTSSMALQDKDGKLPAQSPAPLGSGIVKRPQEIERATSSGGTTTAEDYRNNPVALSQYSNNQEHEGHDKMIGEEYGVGKKPESPLPKPLQAVSEQQEWETMLDRFQARAEKGVDERAGPNGHPAGRKERQDESQK